MVRVLGRFAAAPQSAALGSCLGSLRFNSFAIGLGSHNEFPPVFVVVRAREQGELLSGSSNLPNTHPACECLLDASRCFVARRDLLFVVRSLRGGADAIRKEGQSPTP